MTLQQKLWLTVFVTTDSHDVCAAVLELNLRASSLASKGDSDYDSEVANIQIPSEPRQVDSLSRSGGDNKTNYSIMGIIPLLQPETGVLDR